MAQDLSVEYPDKVVLITIRTIASRLWFVNNQALVENILLYLAKYQEEYQCEVYGFVLLGNHYHLLAKFPLSNRSAFLKAFDSRIAHLVKKHVPHFRDGKLWARRPKVQAVLNSEDVMDRFLYVGLNHVSSGLCEKVSEHNGYTCLVDCFRKHGRKFRVIDWKDFNNRSRYNKKLRPKDCEKEYTLKFSRLPSLEGLSDSEYQTKVQGLIEARRKKIIEARRSSGQGFAGKHVLRKTKAGSMPRNTKTSTRESKRPLVLTLCMESKQRFLEWYFALLDAYKKASAKFRSGKLNAEFPPGTYRPVLQVFP